jgi:hypothetical protein
VQLLGHLERERRDIADDERDLVVRQRRGFGRDAIVERRVERQRLAHARLIVVRHARGLDDARVRRARPQLVGPAHGAAQ